MRPLLCLVAVLSWPGCAPPSTHEESEPMLLPRARPLVIAHRGASAYAPEHTFAAWDLGLAMEADYIEQDLQMTADGVLVVLHDETLDRTVRGEGCAGAVSERTLDELRDCDAGSWFLDSDRGPDARTPEAGVRPTDLFPAQRIQTLEAVLERYRGRARFYIETKSPQRAPGMEEALAALLASHDLAGGSTGDAEGVPHGGAPPPVFLQSFSAASLERLKTLLPAVPRVQLIGGDVDPGELRRELPAIALRAQGIGPAARLVDRALVDAAHALCLEVHPYTVNERSDMVRLLSIGVDGMFTDRPDVLREVVEAGSAERSRGPTPCGTIPDMEISG